MLRGLCVDSKLKRISNMFGEIYRGKYIEEYYEEEKRKMGYS